MILAGFRTCYRHICRQPDFGRILFRCSGSVEFCWTALPLKRQLIFCGLGASRAIQTVVLVRVFCLFWWHLVVQICSSYFARIPEGLPSCHLDPSIYLESVAEVPRHLLWCQVPQHLWHRLKMSRWGAAAHALAPFGPRHFRRTFCRGQGADVAHKIRMA